MRIIEEIAAQLPEGELLDIVMEHHWAGVSVQVKGEKRCGLSSMPFMTDQPQEFISQAFALYRQTGSARALSRLTDQSNSPMASIGVAAINALLPHPPEVPEENAADLLLRLSKGKRVVMVGHFSFADDVRVEAQHLDVLELNPRDGDLPASEAPRVLPQAEVVAITSMTFINNTCDALLALCPPNSTVMVIGPSTPLSPVLFRHGIDILCGSVIQDAEWVMGQIKAGIGFKHLHRQGAQLVVLRPEDFT